MGLLRAGRVRVGGIRMTVGIRVVVCARAPMFARLRAHARRAHAQWLHASKPCKQPLKPDERRSRAHAPDAPPAVLPTRRMWGRLSAATTALTKSDATTEPEDGTLPAAAAAASSWT